MRTLSQIPNEEIKEIISQSESYSLVMNKLNVNRNGSNQTWLKKFIINNNLSIDHFKQNKSKEKCFCLNCGKELHRSRSNQKFCNNKCQNDYTYKLYIERWKNGEETGIIGEYSISRYLKHYLFEKYNNKCCKCGWGKINQYTGNIPLEIEHKDGDYTNNSEDNLELLCPNCHSLTSTYKGANKGKGRTSRNKYYIGSDNYIDKK